MSLVSLKVLENDKRVQEVVYGHKYTLRAEISRPDGKFIGAMRKQDLLIPITQTVFDKLCSNETGW